MRLCKWITAAAALTFAAGPAAAHTFGAQGAGFGAGIGHPLGGLDHVLAMIAIGLWTAQRGGADLWRLPLAFMGTMAIGAGLVLAGAMLPLVEFGIVGSVVLLGLFLALSTRLTSGAAYGLVALFALFHGHGHGTELPEAAHPLLYGLGFLLATGTLHATGIGAGLAAKRFGQTVMAYGLRVTGALIALAGVGLLTQI
jgi:urease accessory protein